MCRVLIVDDETLVQQAFKRAFVRRGHETDVAPDGPSAISKIADALKTLHPFDGVVLDIRLPGMSGWAVLERWRKDAATENLPVVVISGDGRALTEIMAKRQGADDFISKPETSKTVVEKMMDAIYRRGLEREAIAL